MNHIKKSFDLNNFQNTHIDLRCRDNEATRTLGLENTAKTVGNRIIERINWADRDSSDLSLHQGRKIDTIYIRPSSENENHVSVNIHSSRSLSKIERVFTAILGTIGATFGVAIGVMELFVGRTPHFAANFLNGSRDLLKETLTGEERCKTNHSILRDNLFYAETNISKQSSHSHTESRSHTEEAVL